MKLKLLLFLMIVSGTCFSQSNTKTKMTAYSKNNYKFLYPETWKIDSSGTYGAEVFVFSPLENETDKFSENVNIVVQDLSGQNIDLNKYKQITEKQIADIATDGKIIESSILKSDNKEFYKIIYTMTQGKFKLKINSICIIVNDKAFLATFGAEVDKYDSYRVIGEQILESFNLAK